MNATHKVARDLRELEDLSHALLDQAIHKANSTLMPGGEAMVALAPVANQEAWEHRYETAERLAHDTSFVEAEDDNGEPPLQTIRYWSDRYRAILGAEWDHIPTIVTETKFLRFHLDWIAGGEPMWEHFEKAIESARIRMENLLLAGKRVERGVPCLSCNVDLIRPAWDRRGDCGCGPRPTLKHAGHARCDCPFWLRMERSVRHDGEVETITVRVYDKAPLPEGHIHPRPDLACVACRRETEWEELHAAHDRGGLRDEWKCPSCDRRYDTESYTRAVAHAAFIAAEWLPLEDAMARTGAKRGSIQGWASKGVVRKRKDQETGRMTYHVEDIEACKTEPEEAA